MKSSLVVWYHGVADKKREYWLLFQEFCYIFLVSRSWCWIKLDAMSSTERYKDVLVLFPLFGETPLFPPEFCSGPLALMHKRSKCQMRFMDLTTRGMVLKFNLNLCFLVSSIRQPKDKINPVILRWKDGRGNWSKVKLRHHPKNYDKSSCWQICRWALDFEPKSIFFYNLSMLLVAIQGSSSTETWVIIQPALLCQLRRLTFIKMICD